MWRHHGGLFDGKALFMIASHKWPSYVLAAWLGNRWVRMRKSLCWWWLGVAKIHMVLYSFPLLDWHKISYLFFERWLKSEGLIIFLFSQGTRIQFPQPHPDCKWSEDGCKLLVFEVFLVIGNWCDKLLKILESSKLWQVTASSFSPSPTSSPVGPDSHQEKPNPHVLNHFYRFQPNNATKTHLKPAIPGKPVSIDAGNSCNHWHCLLALWDLFGGTEGYLSAMETCASTAL